uniref:neural Wiskott-Aldrich syndrome protein n=1 Tax=Scatophagus argus TaxID=75038 RepID=UPI001ED82366|nr:neural Wiskott-Aldrich syndrome protein [Scatophagus argus]
MASSLTPGCLVMSDLLTIREKGVLFTLLEPQYKLIKTTVAQVLVAKETQGESPGWSVLGCGAVCLIEDESLHSYFLCLYCVKRATLLWKQELYIPFKYTATRMFFHTFPADGHQVGINFANETEAEEFHLAVEAVQRDQEKMIRKIEMTNGTEDGSISDPYGSGSKEFEHLDEEQHFPMDTTSEKIIPATSSDLSWLQTRLTGENPKDKDIAEAVDCIINQSIGLKDFSTVSQTLPRATGASISLALRKGPLPPVPPIKGNTTSQQTPQHSGTLYQSPIPPWIPPPPSTPAPVVPERIRKSASFKHMCCSTSEERGDLILTALRQVLRKRQLGADGSQMGSDTDVQ